MSNLNFPVKIFSLQLEFAYFWHGNSNETFWLVLNHCVKISGRQSKNLPLYIRKISLLLRFLGESKALKLLYE